MTAAPRRRRAWALAALGVLALLGAGWALRARGHDAGVEGAGGAGARPTAQAPGLAPPRSSAPDAPDLEAPAPRVPAPGAAHAGEAPTPPATPALDPRVADVLARHAEHARLKADEDALDRVPPPQGAAGEAHLARRRALEAQLDAAEARLQAARSALIEALRADAALTDAVHARFTQSPPDEVQVLAQVLRLVPDADLGRRLAQDARTATSADTRAAALVALEGRPPALWLDPTREAFLQDADARVREQAAQALTRSLRDTRQAQARPTVRATLLAGLDAADAKQRQRAVRAFLLDPERPAGVRERLEALRAGDPAPSVRSEADLVLRSWAQAASR